MFLPLYYSSSGCLYFLSTRCLALATCLYIIAIGTCHLSLASITVFINAVQGAVFKTEEGVKWKAQNLIKH